MEAGERKRLIVRSAIQTFAKHGFHRSTTKRLAKDAGVSEGLIYRYFPSKEEVYQAVLEHLVESSPQLDLPAGQSEDDEQHLLKFARGLHQFFASQPENIKMLLFSALQGEKISSEFFNRRLINSYKSIMGQISAGQQSGRYRADIQPRVAARGFMGMLMYHAIVQALVQDPFQPGEEVDWMEGFVKIFLQGMLA